VIYAVTVTLALATVQLTEVQVSITIDGRAARVESTYRFSSPADTITYTAIRIPGQSMVVEDSTASGVSSLTGLTRLTRIDPSEAHTIVYRASGNVRRLPLFVPNIPTVAGSRVVSIEVRGADSSHSFADAFPRFYREQNNVLVARLTDVPSFVFLPRRAMLVGANRLAVTMAFVFVAIGTVYWLLRRRRAS